MPKHFTPWESATRVATDAQPGLFPQTTLLPLSIFCILAIATALWPSFGLAAIPVALVLGRLMSLDLTTYTLPNVYTVPLIAVGFLHAFTHNQLIQAVIAAILISSLGRILTHTRLKMGLGGGDLKLLIALFAFMPLTSAFWAIALGCLVWMPVTFAKPKAMVPFGVPLIIGWVLLLACPHLPNWLFSTIS